MKGKVAYQFITASAMRSFGGGDQQIADGSEKEGGDAGEIQLKRQEEA